MSGLPSSMNVKSVSHTPLHMQCMLAFGGDCDQKDHRKIVFHYNKGSPSLGSLRFSFELHLQIRDCRIGASQLLSIHRPIPIRRHHTRETLMNLVYIRFYMVGLVFWLVCCCANINWESMHRILAVNATQNELLFGCCVSVERNSP